MSSTFKLLELKNCFAAFLNLEVEEEVGIEESNAMQIYLSLFVNTRCLVFFSFYFIFYFIFIFLILIVFYCIIVYLFLVK